MMRTFFTLLACALPLLLTSGPVSAQTGTTDGAGDPVRPLGPPSDFGSIPDSLFSLRAADHGSAPYVYALKQLYITFEQDETSIVAVLHHHVRLKVFDASARESSVVSIPYYFDQNMEQVVGLRAATWGPDGSHTVLAEENRRIINVNSRYNILEFTMPEVTDGSVIEYSYRVRRRYIQELPEFYFSHSVPTLLARVSIQYPRYLRYAATAENFGEGEGPLHRVQQVDTSSVPRVFTFDRPEPVTVEHWSARNLPALHEENYITSLNDYRARINFQISEFGVPRQTLENSWGYVVADLRRNRNILGHIAGYERASAAGARIAGETGSPEAARDSIFRFLNSRVNFNGENRASSSAGDSLVLEGGAVDQAAINQTLTAMLRGAGIEAWPLLISTRQAGQVNRNFPSFYQFNAQLCYAVTDGSVTIMDASFRHSQPGLIPVPMYNESGLLLKESSHEWIPVNPENSVFGIDITLRGELDANGNLRGRVEAAGSGYPKQTIRQQMAEGGTAEEVVRRLLFDGYGRIRLSDVQLSQAESYDLPARMSASFEIPEYAVSFTDALEFRPMIVGYLISNPFESPTRDLPVTLDAPEQLNLTYEIAVPDGYSVPGIAGGSGGRALELDGAFLEEEYRMEDDILRYEYRIDISRIKFRKEQFPRLIRLYERWVELSNSVWQVQRN